MNFNVNDSVSKFSFEILPKWSSDVECEVWGEVKGLIDFD